MVFAICILYIWTIAEKISDHSNGDVAIDQYHLYQVTKSHTD